jgi:hypothetical protein
MGGRSSAVIENEICTMPALSSDPTTGTHGLKTCNLTVKGTPERDKRLREAAYEVSARGLWFLFPQSIAKQDG